MRPVPKRFASCVCFVARVVRKLRQRSLCSLIGCASLRTWAAPQPGALRNAIVGALSGKEFSFLGNECAAGLCTRPVATEACSAQL